MLDNRPGASQNIRDMVYTYDGLDRLSEAKRGVDGGNFYGGNQRLSLDMLGNWATFETDTTADGDYLDANEETNRTHNDVNELTGIDTDGDEVTDLDLTFDDAGNLREREIDATNKYRYTHDLWNRLVKIEYYNGTSYNTIGEHEYYGTHWRSVKRADSDNDLTLDKKREQYYSADWQLLEEHVDDDYLSSPGVNRKFQYLWGKRYIDDIIMHREDGNNDGVFDDTTVNDNRWWHLTDVQFSTVALVDGSASLAERIQYDAYGEAIHHEWRDVDGDGDYDATDYNTIVNLAAAPGGTPITNSSYEPDADLDRDGDVDSTDQTLATTNYVSALAKGELSNSTVQNTIGWDGYVFNPETEEYHVRLRCYNAKLGRWLERDPIGYGDGMNAYEYVGGEPLAHRDPNGLFGGFDRMRQKRIGCVRKPTDKFDWQKTATHFAVRHSNITLPVPKGWIEIGFAIFSVFFEPGLNGWSPLENIPRHTYSLNQSFNGVYCRCTWTKYQEVSVICTWQWQCLKRVGFTGGQGGTRVWPWKWLNVGSSSQRTSTEWKRVKPTQVMFTYAQLWENWAGGGYLCGCDDPDDIAAHLQDLLDHDEIPMGWLERVRRKIKEITSNEGS